MTLPFIIYCTLYLLLVSLLWYLDGNAIWKRAQNQATTGEGKARQAERYMARNSHGPVLVRRVNVSPGLNPARS